MVHKLYADFDPDDPDLTRMSLCTDCAKDRSLKRFVEQYAIEGPVCGVCRRTAMPYRVCDPARNTQLANLVKSLIRLNYNEYEYNRHWGGEDGAESLLATEQNIIIDAESHLFFPRKKDDIIEFFYSLLDPPYPDASNGIWLYAGSDDSGGRGLQFALKDRESGALLDLRRRLAGENHYLIEPAVNELLDCIGRRIDFELPANNVYFRARIGVEKRFQRLGEGFFESKITYEALQGNKLGAPPPLLAKAGRLNRAGVAFLYLASDADTAAAEVRPHPGHHISVGKFRTRLPIRVASFDQDITPFSQSENDLGLFHFIHSADRIMAQPVTPEAASRYLITQLLADCLRQRGFGGVTFRSSIASGVNLCIFNPGDCEYVPDSSCVRYVDELKYRLSDAPSAVEGDIELPA